ncbi:MTH1187 family thiamine-binding protein [Oceanidesulfovibrio marinus]|uniref:Thiamine-binding protein n=1 Tax=Oceanidesulfovibrio marinus TaxID=370038 RepID=A0A6P1ZE65_9BACT|nr:MTH1187 family thiamine-binding protein [Oceanidesulfovibrio marinus]QJT08593.1 MTH1187 family thiamine-binding protein [Oceanidesulfovibrio marinus]TVM32573.1 thiamine-binding protein [Oceanidesulfovibrio marinus]
MSAILNLSIFPLDQGEELGVYVARAMDVIEASGLPYVMGPMGTAVEADTVKEVLDVAHKCFEALEPDCHRVYMMMNVDHRKDRTNGLRIKVDSVKAKMGGGKA